MTSVYAGTATFPLARAAETLARYRDWAASQPDELTTALVLTRHALAVRVAYVGGTAIPFNGTAPYYDQYLASAQKFAKSAGDYGATVLLSNHTEFDNGYYKAHTAANRKGAEPNPFEVGRDGVARYFSVVQNCVTAAKARAGKM